MIRGVLLAALWGALAGAAGAAGEGPCREVRFEGLAYTVCEADAARDDLRLWLADDEGAPIGTFARLEALLAERGRRLVFAMNAGMYHPDRRPVGLYVEDGRELSPLVERARGGNFALLPNGVFCIGEGRAAVIETSAFAAARPGCRHATQSGPMLVIGGELHPRFLPDSDSLNIRNGVGVAKDGRRVVFAISGAPVNFHAFARFFRDALGVPDALYLDGSISRLRAPGLGRADMGLPLGPIVGVNAPLDG